MTGPAAAPRGAAALAEALAVTSVHHPMFCDCDGEVRCDGLVEQVDAVLTSGWLAAHDAAVAAEARREAAQDIAAAIKNEAIPGGRVFLDQYDDGYNGGLETAVRVVWDHASPAPAQRPDTQQGDGDG